MRILLLWTVRSAESYHSSDNVVASHDVAGPTCAGIDVVRGVGLVVLHGQPARLEQLARAAGEADLHDRVAAAVGDERAHALPALEIGLPAVDDGDEAREGEDPGGRRAVGPEAERVAHHRAHREAAQHGLPRAEAGARPQLVVQGGELGVGGVEGVGVGIADAWHDVPVVARPARQRQWRPRRHHVQPLLRVEHVAERQQVVLVGAAAVVQDEQPGGLTGGRALAERSGRSCAALCQLGTAAHGHPAAAWA